MRTDGTGVRQLTNDVHRGRGARWSPDGQNIAFFSNRSGNYEIWTILPDGSGLKQLTATMEEVNNFAWSPDGSQPEGRWLYLNRLTPEADIWMLTLNEERE